MKELTLLLADSDKATYLRIADAIRSCIEKDQLRPGEKLPSSRKLSGNLGVSRNTVMVALAELVAEGWLEASERSAYRVSETLPEDYFRTAPTGLGDSEESGGLVWRIARTCDPLDNLFAKRRAYRGLFNSATPDLRLFPLEDFKAQLQDALKIPPRTLMGYSDAQGYPPLLEALDTYLRRARSITGRSIMVTHGSQEAIFLTAQVLLDAGDKVAVSELGYPPAWEALRASGAELIPVANDSEGIDPDAFAHVARKHRIRLIYLTPLHQFPTSWTLSEERRTTLYKIAARHGIPILEDDYDHEFHYRPHTPSPMAASDPEQLVIYVSTFSKLLFPSARIGYIAVPQSLTQPLIRFRRIMNFQNETLMQAAIAGWMNSGGFEKHLRRMRQIYEQRRNLMADCLQSAIDRGIKLSFRLPYGGMALWLNTFRDSDLIVERALLKRFAIHQESVFHLEGHSGYHVRLGFTVNNRQEIVEGIQRLVKIIEEVPVNAVCG